jgi:hypothetical protein
MQEMLRKMLQSGPRDSTPHVGFLDIVFQRLYPEVGNITARNKSRQIEVFEVVEQSNGPEQQRLTVVCHDSLSSFKVGVIPFHRLETPLGRVLHCEVLYAFRKVRIGR